MLHRLFMVIMCYHMPARASRSAAPVPHLSHGLFGNSYMFLLIPLNKQIHETVWMNMFKDKRPMSMGVSIQKSPFFL